MTIEISDDMTEEEGRNLLNNTFKETLESLAERVKYIEYTYARAIGSKIFDLNNGRYAGKVLKYDCVKTRADLH